MPMGKGPGPPTGGALASVRPETERRRSGRGAADSSAPARRNLCGSGRLLYRL